jgi:hypothetical protein
MRIAYVCYWFLFEGDGVAAKIEAQVAQWRAAGHDVEVFCLARIWQQIPTQRSPWRTFSFESSLGRVRATRDLVHAVRAWSPDAVYLRYDIFPPPLPSLLRRVRTLVEINSDDREEAKLRPLRPRAARAVNEINRRAILSRAAGLACVTHELARSPNFASFEKPSIVVGNGVDLGRVPELPSANDGDRGRVAFLGTARQPWHGVDKIAWLAEQLPETDFDIVGYPPQHVHFPVPPNMTVHPPLTHAEYEPILARADVAIGTLALHRKNMREACPLKVREYLGHGIPTVIAYEDTDFLDEGQWYLLRLPNDEDNVRRHVDEIREFVNRMRRRRVPREEVAERIGTEGKEKRRLEFLAGLSR